jgi:lysozyme
MKTSAAGIDFIKSWEGLKTKAYQDSAGVWTIGYGHTRGVRPQMVITPIQAVEYLLMDIELIENSINHLVKVPLLQHQFDALVSFHFNTGKLGASTLLKKLNARRYGEAAKEFLKWKYVTLRGRKIPSAGLIRRRNAEKRMFEEGVYILNK